MGSDLRGAAAAAVALADPLQLGTNARPSLSTNVDPMSAHETPRSRSNTRTTGIGSGALLLGEVRRGCGCAGLLLATPLVRVCFGGVQRLQHTYLTKGCHSPAGASTHTSTRPALHVQRQATSVGMGDEQYAYLTMLRRYIQGPNPALLSAMTPGPAPPKSLASFAVR